MRLLVLELGNHELNNPGQFDPSRVKKGSKENKIPLRLGQGEEGLSKRKPKLKSETLILLLTA